MVRKREKEGRREGRTEKGRKGGRERGKKGELMGMPGAFPLDFSLERHMM